MSRQTNLKLRGSQLKEYCLLHMYDKEAQCKVSVGAFMHGAWKDIGGGCKSRGNVDHWFRHPEIVNVEPYIGEMITEELVFRYNVDKGIINPDELSYSDFTKDTQKIKNKLDENTLLRRVCDDLGYPLTRDIFKISDIRESLIFINGQSLYDKVLERNKKQMLRGL